MTKRISVNNATHADQAKVPVDANAVEAAIAAAEAVTPTQGDAEVHAGKAPVAEHGADVAHVDASAAAAPAELAMVASGDATPAIFAAGGQDTTSTAAETATDDSNDDSGFGGEDRTDLLIGGGLLAAAVVGAVLVGSTEANAEDHAGNPPPPPPANEAPVFGDESQDVTTDEDTAVTVTATATDADGDTLTYTAADGEHGTVTMNDDGSFTYTPDADFSGTDSFVITANDGSDDATQTVNVTINPINDAPTFDEAAHTSTVVENSDVATAVYDANATDGDTGDTITYSLTGTDAGAFNIDADTGEIFFNNSPDFEAQDSYSVTVVATDEAGAQGTQALTVNVTDVDDSTNFNIDLDDDGNINTSAVFDGAAGATVFQEDAALSNNAEIDNLGQDDVVLVSNAEPGDYSFSNIGDELVISFNNTAAGQASEIHITGVVDGSDLVYDEATAEAAVGFDFFQYA